MSTNATQEVLDLYETCGMSIEEIAEETGYDPLAIKNILLGSSSRYRRDNAGTDEALVSDAELKQLAQAAKQLAFTSENDYVRAKMITYLIDEKKGRNDKKANGPVVNVNILGLNDALARAKRLTSGASNKMLVLEDNEVSPCAPALAPVDGGLKND